jgi:hypothetical protein
VAEYVQGASFGVGGSDVQRDGPLVGEQPGLDRAVPLLDRNLRGKVPRDGAEARANPFGTSASADERPGLRGLEPARCLDDRFVGRR